MSKTFLTRNLREHDARAIETLASAPSYPWGKWGIGIGVFLWLGIKGVGFIIRGEAIWHGRGGASMTLRGTDAVLLGALFICIGLFCHFHFFWGNTERLEYYHHAGKVLSALAFVGVMGVLFWRLVSAWG